MLVFPKRKIFVIGVVSIIGVAWLVSANTAQATTIDDLLAQIDVLQI